MEASEVISAFHRQLDEVQAQGNSTIPLQAIRAYLQILERDSASSQEHRNREHQGMRAEYSAKTELSIEMLKSVLEAGKSALHYLLLINGGAVVALLGVLSNLAGNKGGIIFAKYLALPMLQFGVGVLLAATGFAMRYFSQAFYASVEGDDRKYMVWGDLFRNLAIAVGLGGYVIFGFAITNAYNAVIWSF